MLPRKKKLLKFPIGDFITQWPGHSCRFCGNKHRENSIAGTLHFQGDTPLAVSEAMQPQNLTVVYHKTTSCK